ncbi:transmembrane protein 220-like isoform X2 [Stegodyphus dumicola]|uniref:transmembrane protein 220-like isoform X2 n=1 Tax=Stegodyphus dumicola TaxID=202533 RepID=UPI0015AA3408|nr:transmembrane protein 220-like isoform X2 [Stegodyphus dumicola]
MTSVAMEEVIELKEPLQRVKDTEAEDEVTKKSEKQKASESGGKIIWRGANSMMTLFFIMASGVQPLYGTAAILTACIAIRPNLSGHKRWRFLYWLHAVFCLGMFCYAFVELVIAAVNPESDGSLNPLTYEEGREMAGVLITTIWLFTCKQSPTIKSDSSTRKKKGQSTITIFIVIFSFLPLLLWALCYSNVLNATYFSVCSDFYVDEFSF